LQKVVADSGYGSEDNYDFMEINDIEPFVKFPYFHKEQKRAFKNNAFCLKICFTIKKRTFLCVQRGNEWKKPEGQIAKQTAVLCRMQVTMKPQTAKAVRLNVCVTRHKAIAK
jgi:hypothetical protein